MFMYIYYLQKILAEWKFPFGWALYHLCDLTCAPVIHIIFRQDIIKLPFSNISDFFAGVSTWSSYRKCHWWSYVCIGAETVNCTAQKRHYPPANHHAIHL